MSEIKTLFFDLETTGLPINGDYSHINIIEIGWAVTDNNFNIIKKENYLINGDFEITDFITNLTGISKQDTINNGVQLLEAINHLFKDINNVEILIAHNIHYDYSVLLSELTENSNKIIEFVGYIKKLKNKIRLDSTIILNNECKKSNYNVPNKKLQSFYNTLIKTDCIQTHRAIDDVMMIVECLNKLDNVNILDYFLNKKAHCGKYKGKTMLSIYNSNTGYYKWLLINWFRLNVSIHHLFYPKQIEEIGIVVDDDIVVYDTVCVKIPEDDIDKDNEIKRLKEIINIQKIEIEKLQSILKKINTISLT